ncbi:MAG: GH25 family lysozyme, partial [Pirellulales bacterium]
MTAELNSSNNVRAPHRAHSLMRCPTTKVLFWFTVCLVVLGAVSPVCALIEGVDVSNYQGSINWTSVKNAGIQFAFCKATEGVDYVDP